MKVYLAGRMSGLPDDNYPAFHAAAARIRARDGGGHECVNPAELHEIAPPGLTPAQRRARWIACMKVDIPHLLTCDAVVVLPDWMLSEGARLEVYIAVRLGLPIILESTWTTLNVGNAIAIRDLLASSATVVPQAA